MPAITKTGFCFPSLSVLFRKITKILLETSLSSCKSNPKGGKWQWMEGSRNWYNCRFPLRLGFSTCFLRSTNTYHHDVIYLGKCNGINQLAFFPHTPTPFVPHTELRHTSASRRSGKGQLWYIWPVFSATTPVRLQDDFPHKDFSIFPLGCQEESQRCFYLLHNFS